MPADEGASTRSGLRATVLASLANGMFRLQTSDGREVEAHTALDLRKAFTRLLPGDPVVIELSPFDPGRARICSLIKSPQRSDSSTPPAGRPRVSSREARSPTARPNSKTQQPDPEASPRSSPTARTVVKGESS
jgi:translation initiation factor IF-1